MTCLHRAQALDARQITETSMFELVPRCILETSTLIRLARYGGPEELSGE